MNILLTSVGRRTYMIDYFKQALSGIGEVFAANSVYTYSLSHADSYIITPLIYDTCYIDFLLDFCKKKCVTVILSLFDIDLFILAKNKQRFLDEGIKLVVSDMNCISICNDKWECFNFFTENKINTPKTFISIDDVYLSLEADVLFFPLILKPRWGMGSLNVYQADNKVELNLFYNKLKKNIFDTYLKYESELDPECCIVMQEKICGEEIGLDILNDLNGNYIATVAKKKISMRAGETDIAEIISSDLFAPISQEISMKLKHIGNLDVDAFLLKTGEVKALEMNCRFGGQYPFSHIAGVNFPKQIINWLHGLPTDQSLINAKIGVVGCKDLLPVRLYENDK